MARPRCQYPPYLIRSTVIMPGGAPQSWNWILTKHDMARKPVFNADKIVYPVVLVIISH